MNEHLDDDVMKCYQRELTALQVPYTFKFRSLTLRESKSTQTHFLGIDMGALCILGVFEN